MRRTGPCVGVRDEGPGLSQEDQAKLFQRGARLTPRPTGDESCTGYGLAVAKELIGNLGGKIWCESVLGQGACFSFRLPAYQERVPDPGPDLPGHRADGEEPRPGLNCSTSPAGHDGFLGSQLSQPLPAGESGCSRFKDERSHLLSHRSHRRDDRPPSIALRDRALIHTWIVRTPNA